MTRAFILEGLIMMNLLLFAVPGITESVSDRYTPVKGGWHIHIASSWPRQHIRLLYPPADKAMIWSKDDLKKIERRCFRPAVIAFLEPRFQMDFHTAGGLLGHLYAGLSVEGGKSKWFHQWSDIDVSYVDGRLDYTLRDADFPGVVVSLSASALSDSAGMALKVEVKGLKSNGSLVWGYGGASSFVNYNLNSETYSPSSCATNSIHLLDGQFSLTRKPATQVDDNSGATSLYTVKEFLPDWQPVVKGGSSWSGGLAFGDPKAFSVSPDALAESAEHVSDSEKPQKTDRVVVQSIPLAGGSDVSGYIVVGMGGDISKGVAHPARAWQSAMKRNRGIADRIVIHTPDPYLDSAMPMAAFLTEGMWGDETVLHGAWSWRFGYLGWRGWYGLNCYGWTDRIKKSIDTQLSRCVVQTGDDRGAVSAMLESSPYIYYNMDEVFIDSVRQYLEYTNDVETMRRVFPVIQGIVEWENRRLQPENECLYESCLSVQISDSHWYIRGQVALSSSYMLRANELLADLASRLGENPAPFRERAQLIRSAMQRKLWQPRRGVFAEFLDTRGNRMLHPEPALPTIVHSSEFGAASPLQIYQMLHWIDTSLETKNLGDGKKLFWNSNWSPGYSHWEPFYGDNSNLAQVECMMGRADEGYNLLRSVMQTVYNSNIPGGFASGQSQCATEFSDTAGIWTRAVVEGIFGIAPKRPDGYVDLNPQFPSDWPEASINTPHFSYNWKRDGGKEFIAWQSPVKTSVHLRLAIRASDIKAVMVDGKPAKYRVEPGVSLTWVLVNTPTGRKGTISVSYVPSRVVIPGERVVKQGEDFELKLSAYSATDYIDPQGLIHDRAVENGILSGKLKCEPGPGVLFLASGTKACPMWMPIALWVEPETPAQRKAWSAPQVPSKDLKWWELIDLSKIYNASSPVEMLERVASSAKPPALPASQIGFGYWQDHLLSRCTRGSKPPTDAAWRAKVEEDNIAWTADGVPFKTAKNGPNIGVVTLAGGYPASIEIPVGVSGRTLYLMLSGITFPIQSHVVNLRITLQYADGQVDRVDLTNPSDITSCYQTGECSERLMRVPPQSGFENIGGRSGPAGRCELQGDGSSFQVDTMAQLLPFELRRGSKLETVEIGAVANDVVFGVMGATVLKSE